MKHAAIICSAALAACSPFYTFGGAGSYQVVSASAELGLRGGQTERSRRAAPAALEAVESRLDDLRGGDGQPAHARLVIDGVGLPVPGVFVNYSMSGTVTPVDPQSGAPLGPTVRIGVRSGGSGFAGLWDSMGVAPVAYILTRWQTISSRAPFMR